MKTKLALAVILISIFSAKSYSQIAFGVSPGLSFNSAYVGYKIADRIVPFVGFQYAGAKLSSESTVKHSERLNGISMSEEYSSDGEATVKLFLPSIGAKLFIAEKNNLKAFTNITLTKPIIKGNSKSDGETDEEFADQINAIKLWGGELGVGAEYFFDENFSIGGEFGVRYIHLKFEDKNSESNYDYYSSYSYNTEQKISLNVMPTYSKISLNFYF